MSAETKAKTIPRWKMAVVVWLGIYPTITLVLALIGKYILPLPIPVYLKTLPITLIVVPLMVYVVQPFLNKLFSKWLMRS
jgi:antibiotic biosynthesis monooxygenase (ABM) superfamily enzyme